MSTSPTPNLTDWLACIPDRSAAKDAPLRRWFEGVFSLMSQLGFHVENPQDITSGHPLIWKCDHAQVIARRQVSLPIEGDSRPGIECSDDLESWEAVFSARTPHPVIFEALRHLFCPEG